jgi:hypothetical protein
MKAVGYLEPLPIDAPNSLLDIDVAEPRPEGRLRDGSELCRMWQDLLQSCENCRSPSTRSLETISRRGRLKRERWPVPRPSTTLGAGSMALAFVAIRGLSIFLVGHHQKAQEGICEQASPRSFDSAQ